MKKANLIGGIIIGVVGLGAFVFFMLADESTVAVPVLFVFVIAAALVLYTGQSDKMADKGLDKHLREIGSAESAEAYEKRSVEYAHKHPPIRIINSDMIRDLKARYRRVFVYFLLIIDVVFLLALVEQYNHIGLSFMLLIEFVAVIALGYYCYYMLTGGPIQKFISRIRPELYDEINADYLGGELYYYGSCGLCIGNKYAVYFDGDGVSVIPLADIIYAGKFIRVIKHYTNGVYSGSEYKYIVRIVTSSPCEMNTHKNDRDFYPVFHKYGLHQILGALEKKGVQVRYEMNVPEGDLRGNN